MPASPIDRVYRAIPDADRVDLATRMTLVLFLVSDWVIGADWQFKLPLRVLAILGLVAPPLHRSRGLWLAVSLVMGWKTAANWWTQDNHVFLATYWSLAIWLSLTTEGPARPLAANARVLIGLSFAFAALWKVALSGDFLDGTYFHYTFLTDPRFRDFAALVGGVTDATWDRNLEALAQLASPVGTVEAVTLHDTPRLLAVARLTAWWTAGIESALAVAFLVPARLAVARYRHVLLLLFAWTTYLVASVETFGWTLLALGVAQCEPELRRTRLLYVLTGFVVLAYDYVPVLSFTRVLVGT